MHPKVVFVDGPTAIGKGYFIENFMSQYREKFPNKRVELLIATDFTLKGVAVTELRKYTTYKTEHDKITTIFQGHIGLIQHLKDTLYSEKQDAPDLILIDRSFLTFLCHNVYMEKDVSNYINTFNIYVKETFKDKDFESLFITLDIPIPGVTRCVNILLERIASRNDKKVVDIDWLYTLVSNYRKYRSEMNNIFSYAEVCSSGEYDIVFNRYFK